MSGDEIALTDFIDDYLHGKWAKEHPNNSVECQCTLKPRNKFRNDINYNGQRKDNVEYEYHALLDPEAIDPVQCLLRSSCSQPPVVFDDLLPYCLILQIQ